LACENKNKVKRAIFLDRDGVINRAVVRNGKPYPPATLDDFVLLPGVVSAILALRQAGFLIIVVTNQPDVATGLQRREVVEAMHEKLLSAQLCDEVKACYHIDADGCDCRKPKPGMLLDAARKWQIDLKSSFMVGDRWRDVQAGKSVGCFTYFIDYQYQEKAPDKPDETVTSLKDAVQSILQKFNSKGLVDAKN
jgi:D-glycero-D-manno-heptose 1,7-bisphosphate phosphatase